MSVRIDDPTAVIKLEELARLQAFHRFKEEILFSLNLWSIDENIRRELPSVKDWVGQCVGELNNIFADGHKT